VQKGEGDETKGKEEKGTGRGGRTQELPQAITIYTKRRGEKIDELGPERGQTEKKKLWNVRGGARGQQPWGSGQKALLSPRGTRK